MGEYIERENALKVLAAGRGCGTICYRAISNIPAADVAPVRHGYWKLIGADKQGRGGEWLCMAEGCGRTYPYKCNYCPNCGARMDGGADNA